MSGTEYYTTEAPYPKAISESKWLEGQDRTNRQPFSSPNPSITTVTESEGGNTSGQEEFHLQRYSDADSAVVSRDGRRPRQERKPDLNIVTNFTRSKLPIKTEDVVINQVASRRARARRQRALSVISQKGVQVSGTPVDTPSLRQSKMFSLEDLKRSAKQRQKAKRERSKRNGEKQFSPEMQRIPIGITIPERDAEAIRQNMTSDSALPLTTPLTPAIVVTPAVDDSSWEADNKAFTNSRRPVSSIYSAFPIQPAIASDNVPPVPQISMQAHRNITHEEDHHVMGARGPRQSSDSAEMILPDSAETARPKSQGWWNVMLSPLLRNPSVASKMSRNHGSTPPVPPLPFLAKKSFSPPMSARSDPSFVVSEDNDTSPDTPRRIGMASARASTWSRWTTWEKQRENKDISSTPIETPDSADRGIDEVVSPINQTLDMSVSKLGQGLAAEYYHACAIEQATGEPYFECCNHSCLEQLPQLHSIHDGGPRQVELASPFDSSRGLSGDIQESQGGKRDTIQSPSVLSDAGTQLSPNELSPNVREANTVAVVKAKALDSSRAVSMVQIARPKSLATSNGSGQSVHDEPMPQSRSIAAFAPPAQNNSDLPNIASVAKADTAPSVPDPAEAATAKQLSFDNPPPVSPGPLSPEAHRALAPDGAVPMAQYHYPHQQPSYTINNYATDRSTSDLLKYEIRARHESQADERASQEETAKMHASTLQALQGSDEPGNDRSLNEKDESSAKKPAKVWRAKGCLPRTRCLSRKEEQSRVKRRWLILIVLVLLTAIVTPLILVLTLTRTGTGTPIQSQWLNLTGFPPMPTGISTIAVPVLANSNDQCVVPSNMWSCSLPKDDHEKLNGNEPDQPNFRFEIMFRNGTVANNLTNPAIDKRANDPFTNELYTPNPEPPNTADQIFLGNTTDNITAPFQGEKTPFFITFLSPFPILPNAFNTSNKDKRWLEMRDNNLTISKAIPAPAIDSNGLAANTTLVPTEPFPFSQPVRLYNRGLPDEHYGFYMYYDKSMFLSGYNVSTSSESNVANTSTANNADGGSPRLDATARCVFAQTRFLVKMFTNPSFEGELLGPTNNAPVSFANVSLTDTSDVNPQDSSSATTFTQPGSFPYPASIVIDRHGGDIDKKIVYCYGMDGETGTIINDEKQFVQELRGVGGTGLINAAATAFGGSNGVGFNKTAGGIDGGTGGCGCTWQNWK